MAIKFSGEFEVKRTPEEVYDFLTDPRKFAPLLPEYQGMSVQDATLFTVKVSGILHRHALIFRQQRGKLPRVGEEVIYLFRSPLDLEFAGELDRHFLRPFHILGGQLNRLEDVLVPGAAAGIAGNRSAHFFVGWL